MTPNGTFAWKENLRSFLKGVGAPIFIVAEMGDYFDVFWFVVSTHLKNIRQDGSFPQIGLEVESKRYLKPPPGIDSGIAALEPRPLLPPEMILNHFSLLEN